MIGLLDTCEFSSIRPPPFEWGAVVAVYAAVHYVNAFLYERLGFTPDGHIEKTRYLHSLPNRITFIDTT